MKIKIYSWNIGRLTTSDQQGYLKRTETRRMFKEGRQLLRRRKVGVVLIALSGIEVADYSELSFRLQEFDFLSEVEDMGFNYTWTRGLLVFWKALDSP